MQPKAQRNQNLFFFSFFLLISLSSADVNINFAGLLSGNFLPNPPTAAPPTPAPTLPPTPAPTSAPTPPPVPDYGLQPIRPFNVNPPFGVLSRGMWNEIRTTGRTICAFGSPYSFFVRVPANGDTSKLYIEFEGGGACWNSLSCSDPSFFSGDVNHARWRVLSRNGTKDPSVDPFTSWTQVFVPYCTGDLLTGSKVTVYPGGPTVFHKGNHNVQAVLSWLQNQNLTPKQVGVTGFSAGGYAAAIYYPTLRSMYPQSKFASFLDSSAGVALQLPWFEPFWGYQSTFAPIFQNVTTFQEMMQAVLTAYPNDVMGTFSRSQDLVQYGFNAAALGTLVSPPKGYTIPTLAAQITAEFRQLAQQNPQNFRYFLMGGTNHCVLNNALFATEVANGVHISSWVNDLISGLPVSNVDIV